MSEFCPAAFDKAKFDYSYFDIIEEPSIFREIINLNSYINSEVDLYSPLNNE